MISKNNTKIKFFGVFKNVEFISKNDKKYIHVKFRFFGFCTISRKSVPKFLKHRSTKKSLVRFQETFFVMWNAY